MNSDRSFETREEPVKDIYTWIQEQAKEISTWISQYGINCRIPTDNEVIAYNLRPQNGYLILMCNESFQGVGLNSSIVGVSKEELEGLTKGTHVITEKRCKYQGPCDGCNAKVAVLGKEETNE